MGPAFRRIADIYVARAEAIAKVGSAGIATLVHGDAHLGNLFVNVDGGDRTGFLDLAVVCRAPGRRDVACVRCNSIPIDVRKANERARCPLLRSRGDHRDRRAAGGGHRHPDAPGDAWQQYRLFAVYPWLRRPRPPA